MRITIYNLYFIIRTRVKENTYTKPQTISSVMQSGIGLHFIVDNTFASFLFVVLRSLSHSSLWLRCVCVSIVTIWKILRVRYVWYLSISFSLSLYNPLSLYTLFLLLCFCLPLLLSLQLVIYFSHLILRGSIWCLVFFITQYVFKRSLYVYFGLVNTRALNIVIFSHVFPILSLFKHKIPDILKWIIWIYGNE